MTLPTSATAPSFAGPGRPEVVGRCRIAETVVLDDGTVGAIRVEDFFTDAAATALYEYVSTAVVFERDDIGDTKRAKRAARDGDLPDDPIRTVGAAGPAQTTAQDALAVFCGDWFLKRLSRWLDTPTRVLRPSTPYRLDAGDYIGPHDDHPAPEYRLSVACHLTPDSEPTEGGETRVGLVDTVEEYDHDEFFFPLQRWRLKPGERALRPVFNSALLIPLSATHGHAVSRVDRGSRYSITTLYGADRDATQG